VFGRRRWLQLLGTVPGLSAYGASQTSRGGVVRDYFKDLGVRPFINAAGTFTALTASIMAPEAQQAWNYAAGHFVPLGKLHDAVGERIAQLIGAEAAMVTSGAAGALAVGMAGVLTGDDPDKIKRLPDLTGMKTEVIIQKSHRFGYDHSLRACGIHFVEVETAEQVHGAVGEKTALMFFFNDASYLGKIGDEEWVRLARQHNIPTFNDCAADVPPVGNLSKHLKMGFDLVAFSGGKGLRGPQSAGLLLGRKDLVAAARLNTSPNSDTLTRGMKVNKEEMLAMMAAVEAYLKRDHDADWREWERRCNVIANAISGIKGVSASINVPPVANHVPHLNVEWDAAVIRKTPLEIRQLLSEGTPAIEVSPKTTAETLIIGVWMMETGQETIVAQQLEQALRRASA